MKKGMQKLFGKFGKDFRVADVPRAAKLATLRCEPLEGREMLSATGLGAAAIDEVAYVATTTNSESEMINVSSVEDASSAEYTGVGMTYFSVDWEALNDLEASITVNSFNTYQNFLRDDVVIDFEKNTIFYPDGTVDNFEYEDIVVNYDERFKLRRSDSIVADLNDGGVFSVSQSDYYSVEDGGYHHSTAHALIRPTDFVFADEDAQLVQAVTFEIPTWMDIDGFTYVVVDLNANAGKAQEQGYDYDFNNLFYTINDSAQFPVAGTNEFGQYYVSSAALQAGTNVIVFNEPVFNCFDDLRLDVYAYSPELMIGADASQRLQIGQQGPFTTTEFTVLVADSQLQGLDVSRYAIDSLTVSGKLATAAEGEDANAFDFTVDLADLTVVQDETTGDLILTYNAAIPQLDQGGLYEIEYVLNYGIKDADGFYRQGVDKYVPVELTASESYSVVIPGVVLNEPVWNLDDYSAYKSFKLDATPDANTTATLYGLEKDGATYTELQTWDFVGPEAVAKISGRDFKAENLWITESATKLLAGVTFDGGKALLDSLTLDGTDGDDAIAITTETVKTETQVFTANPYEKTLESYKKTYGEESAIYQKIAENLNAAYERLSKIVTTKTSTWGVVDINGEITKFLGARDVAINAGAGDDVFSVDALRYNYSIASSDGVNTLDFSESTKRLNLDLGASYKQYALVGDGGTLALDGAFTRVFGTKQNDRVVGTEAGLTFAGREGSDSVTFVGGENSALLVGPRQSVVARGDGNYKVIILDGDFSVVNAGGVKKGGTTIANVYGANVSVFGGRGFLGGTIEGDYAIVDASATRQADLEVEGRGVSVTTGAGDDLVLVEGDNATVRSGAGNDWVEVEGAFANVYLGEGNDVCLLADGEAEESEEDDSEEGDSGKEDSEKQDSDKESVKGNSNAENSDTENSNKENSDKEQEEDKEKAVVVGFNRVWGEGGNDFIVAYGAAGTNYFYAGAGDDVIVGGAGKDYIYANSGANVLVGLGGADYIYGGVGRDVIVGSTSTNAPATPAPGGDDEGEEFDPNVIFEYYGAIQQSWVGDQDLDATVALLGDFCVSDGAKDRLYRGGGRFNLFYSSLADGDFTNALERSPFNDVVKLNDPDAPTDEEGEGGEEDDA